MVQVVNYSHGCEFDGLRDQKRVRKVERCWLEPQQVKTDLKRRNFVSDIHIYSNETIRKSGFSQFE